MGLINVSKAAAGLPQAWSSERLALVGNAWVKVLRMDELGVEEERHGDAEALLVLDGRLEMQVGDQAVSVGPGEMYVMPAGVGHTVRPGSRGTLVIVDSAVG